MKIPVLVIACLFLSAGCRKTSTPAPPTTQPSPVAQLDHSQGGSTVVAETKHFKGSIGTSLVGVKIAGVVV